MADFRQLLCHDPRDERVKAAHGSLQHEPNRVLVLQRRPQTIRELQTRAWTADEGKSGALDRPSCRTIGSSDWCRNPDVGSRTSEVGSRKSSESSWRRRR